MSWFTYEHYLLLHKIKCIYLFSFWCRTKHPFPKKYCGTHPLDQTKERCFLNCALSCRTSLHVMGFLKLLFLNRHIHTCNISRKKEFFYSQNTLKTTWCVMSNNSSSRWRLLLHVAFVSMNETNQTKRHYRELPNIASTVSNVPNRDRVWVRVLDAPARARIGKMLKAESWYTLCQVRRAWDSPTLRLTSTPMGMSAAGRVPTGIDWARHAGMPRPEAECKIRSDELGYGSNATAARLCAELVVVGSAHCWWLLGWTRGQKSCQTLSVLKREYSITILYFLPILMDFISE